jgi:hypothetical protein
MTATETLDCYIFGLRELWLAASTGDEINKIVEAFLEVARLRGEAAKESE